MRPKTQKPGKDSRKLRALERLAVRRSLDLQQDKCLAERKIVTVYVFLFVYVALMSVTLMAPSQSTLADGFVHFCSCTWPLCQIHWLLTSQLWQTDISVCVRGPYVSYIGF